MRSLPSGTVTFVFTDIEGSTRLLQEVGDRYADVLSAHRRTLRDVFKRHGGVEVDTQGDAFFYAFATAWEATAAAEEAQERLAAGPVRVRMGLHTGEASIVENEYVGLDVHKGARIAFAGHGGQVLLSQTTRDLVGAEVRDLGLHQLKDFSQRERLFQLGTTRFPPLATLYRTNLPTAGTAFIGRDRELKEISTLLGRRDARLVTLTGPGGTGKTRLALQAAAEAADQYPDGVFWVGLAPLRDARLVLPTVAAALETEDEPSNRIGDKRVLLLLDNFEHVVAAAPQTRGLIDACANLDILTTSREPLHISIERVLPVTPLGGEDAVQVFLERARTIQPDFTDDGLVAEICRRVDGLPLAIELAAARINALSSAAILERLEKRLTVLTGGPRDAPERQQTLRATIDWSYELLDDEERRLFARLSVFGGGCTLAAAEYVCEASLDVLASLVDKSLLRAGMDRYWMLETLREYARERLDEHGEANAVMHALAEYMITIGRANRQASIPGEIENVRAAIAWTLTSGQLELELRLAAVAQPFRPLPSEHTYWLDVGLRHASEVPPRTHADALAAASMSAYRLGDLKKSTALAGQSLSIYRTLGPNEPPVEIICHLGIIATAEGDYARAKAWFEEGLELATRLSYTMGRYDALHLLGELEQHLGDPARATELLTQSMELARRAGDSRRQNLILGCLADVALAEHDLDQAAGLYRKGLRYDRSVEDWRGASYAVAGLAVVAAIQADIERAGRLWGGLGGLEQALGWHVTDFEITKYEHMVADYCDTASFKFIAAAERGRRMNTGEVIEYALAEGF